MEIQPAADLDEEDISAVSSRLLSLSSPSSFLLPYQTDDSNQNFTRIDRKLYVAAMKGDFQELSNEQNLESLLTPNKNTVLHIHLTSTTSQTVSEEFVTKILKECGCLVLLPNAKGETLLHMAARYGHSNIATLLLEHVKRLFFSRVMMKRP